MRRSTWGKTDMSVSCWQQSIIEKILSSSKLIPISEQQLVRSILRVEDLETGKWFRVPL
jgi:hypothetical protein